MSILSKKIILPIFLCLIALIGCNNGGSNSISNPAQSSSSNIMLHYALISNSDNSDIDGFIVGNDITLRVPYGTKLTSLRAKFVTTSSRVTVASKAQVSGITINDFSKVLKYDLTDLSGHINRYNVHVDIANKSEKNILQYSINGYFGKIIGNQIYVMLPENLQFNKLVAKFVATGQVVEVNKVKQVSGINVNDFSSGLEYKVLDANGDSKIYHVNVYHSDQTLSPKFTSFSLNGYGGIIEGNTITVYVPNGTSPEHLVATFTTSTITPVFVDGLAQISGFSSNSFYPSRTFVLSNAYGNYDYTVTVRTPSNQGLIITKFALDGYNGIITMRGPNDGVINNINVTVPYNTDVKHLVASFSSTGGYVYGGPGARVIQTSNVTPNDFTSPLTYITTDGGNDNSVNYYTVTVTVAQNNAKSILAYYLDGYIGIVKNDRISVTLPYGTNLNGLIASVDYVGSSLSLDGVTQINGTTENKFIIGQPPKIYTVTAADGSYKNYQLSVNIARKSDNEITSFSLGGNPGFIDEQNHTITVAVPALTPLNALIATYATTGKSLTVNGKLQTNSITPNNFNSPVRYKVMAADGTTSQYVVIVKYSSLSSFSVLNENGTIDEDNHVITVHVPYGTDVSSLAATFVVGNNSNVSVNGKLQISGVTTQNFNAPVIYTVVNDSGLVEYAVHVVADYIKFGYKGTFAPLTSISIAGKNSAYTCEGNNLQSCKIHISPSLEGTTQVVLTATAYNGYGCSQNTTISAMGGTLFGASYFAKDSPCNFEPPLASPFKLSADGNCLTLTNSAGKSYSYLRIISNDQSYSQDRAHDKMIELNNIGMCGFKQDWQMLRPNDITEFYNSFPTSIQGHPNQMYTWLSMLGFSAPGNAVYVSSDNSGYVSDITCDGGISPQYLNSSPQDTCSFGYEPIWFSSFNFWAVHEGN